MIEFPEKMSIGEAYGPAMEITDQQKADEYFEALVVDSMRRFGKSRLEAEGMMRCNLGYFAGYYGDETRERVERLFCCVHPIFGSIVRDGPPTQEEAFEAGKAMAKGRIR